MERAQLEAALRRGLGGFESLAGWTRLTGGASRETYRIEAVVDGRQRFLALRRAPGDGASAVGEGSSIALEAALIAAARRAGVEGPDVRMSLIPEDGLGAGFLMDWISGETIGSRIVRRPEFAGVRSKMARACGEILAHLHAVDIETEELSGALPHMTPEEAVCRTLTSYRELDSPQPMIEFTARWLLEHLPKENRTTLVHGDFRCGNFIVDPGEGILAVLDWELAHVGDPMRDLGWLCTRSWRFGVNELPVGGFGQYQDLFEGYEAVSGYRVDPVSVRFWEVFGSFWWSVGCLQMAQSYRTGAETSLERPAIGRRSSECQIDCANMLIPGPVTPPSATSRTLSATSLPGTHELLRSVRDFLRHEIGSDQNERNVFLARVGANSLDTVMRELLHGAAARDEEARGLEGILGHRGELEDMRRDLCRRIADRSIAIDDSALKGLLRSSVLAQCMIDQPSYPGVVEALAQTNAA
ncbi:MAG: phosphotransferase family protein [Alphaproteobacteria bacterium]|nr:phosphotransferase family protein [Alphaproteobacteria bacterium]